MQLPSDFVTRASDRLLRWRWPIMAFIGLVNSAVETAERRAFASSSPDAYYAWEILLFGIIGPLSGGIALTLLVRARERRRRADHHLSLHRELFTLLGEVQDWADLTALVVRYPRRVVDLRGAGLILYDQARDRYHLEAQWWEPTEEPIAGLRSAGEPRVCAGCAALQSATSATMAPLRCSENDDPGLGDRYCLPLIYGGRLVALLFLYRAPGAPLAEDEGGALGAMAASMAIALHDARPQRSAMIQAEAADAERRRIARDLHDTLGQSLGYLNLKLDQLMVQDPVRGNRDVHRELERMRAVADDAYSQVRATLSNLQAPAPPDIETALKQEAQQAAARAGFELKVSSQGVPHALPPHTRRHLVYLVGEAVANIERHAGAHQVELRLAWADDRLDIRLLDDGCGFEPDAAAGPGHFGLETMEQRAMAIHGALTVTSSPGSGTEVRLSLPITLRPAVSGEV